MLKFFSEVFGLIGQNRTLCEVNRTVTTEHPKDSIVNKTSRTLIVSHHVSGFGFPRWPLK